MKSFIDQVEITVQAGKGGDGAVGFRRGPYEPKGGPDGGDGGSGGQVLLVADAALTTLLNLQYRRHYRAEDGRPGGPANRTGRSGADLQLRVPVGTIVKTADGGVLADLTTAGQRFVAARGGRGGRGNARFASATNRAPRMAEKGEPGQSGSLQLELRLLADVGLVGMPNAGKSTLLAQVSAARPKTGAYPFTTTRPQLGVVDFGDGDSCVMADIPGLIAGAHAGVGLGHQFLRHIQRTRVLLYILDAAGTEGRDPVSDLALLREELRLYEPRLLDLPALIALNKMDLPAAQAARADVKAQLGDRYGPVIAISAATGQGVKNLLQKLRQVLAAAKEEPVATDVQVTRVYRLEKTGPPFTIARFADGWRVQGQQVERLVVMTDLDNEEALTYLWRRLRRLGLEEGLRQAGAVDGDTIYIGEEQFTFTSPEALQQ